MISGFFVEKKLCFDSFIQYIAPYRVSKVIIKHTKLSHNHPNCFTNDINVAPKSTMNMFQTNKGSYPLSDRSDKG